MTKVLQIVPSFPPSIDGVGDYACILAEKLRDKLDWSFCQLACRPHSEVSGDTEVIRVRESSCLIEHIQKYHRIILHYVGYGYHPRGIPIWLVRGLAAWKRIDPGNQLIVIFHEIWSSGPPWRSEFYLSGIQRLLVRKLQCLSSRSFTSTEVMWESLDRILPGKTVFSAVPSNLEEPSQGRNSWCSGGLLRLVVFGKLPTRISSLKVHKNLIARLDESNLLDSVLIMGEAAGSGKEMEVVADVLNPSKIRFAHEVDQVTGARYLSECDMLLSHYPPHLCTKSGVIMAALSAGCVPVLSGEVDLKCFGGRPCFLNARAILHSGLLGEDSMISARHLKELGGNGQNWYTENASWDHLGAVFRDSVSEEFR